MLPTTQALYEALRANLAEIEMQIKHIKNDIALQYPEEDRDKINVWYWMQKPNGTYVLEEMLAAKAQILSGMAALKAADVASKAASSVLGRSDGQLLQLLRMHHRLPQPGWGSDALRHLPRW